MKTVDGFLADLRRLADLACISSEQLLRCAFIAGLPEDVSNKLRAESEINHSSLASIVQQARVLMSKRVHANALVTVKKSGRNQKRSVKITDMRENFGNNGKPKCFRCKGDHLIKNCPDVVCFKCNEKGHMANECFVSGKSSAPRVSPKQD